MIKIFFIVLITFITIFLPESQAWATVNKSEKVVQGINISIDKSVFLSIDNSPAVIAERKTENNSSLWYLSILIPGLGQSLMGDADRSNKFFVLSYAPVFIGAILSVAFAIAQILSASINSISTTFLILMIPSVSLSLYFYIQNIFDAYIMSKDLNSKEISTSDKKRQIINIMDSIKVNKDNISITALSF